MASVRYLYLIDNTLGVIARSGVQRVVVNLGKALARLADVDFVKWDKTEGQLRYADRSDLACLFRSKTLPHGVRINPYAHRRMYRFGDTLAGVDSVWLIQPEIAYHKPHGELVFSKIIAQCAEYGAQVASIYYDDIPINNDGYSHLKNNHVVYTNRLVKSDLILPISTHSGTQLRKYYNSLLPDQDEFIAAKIVPVSLPDRDEESFSHSRSANAPERVILMVGTVERRKRQIETIQAFNSLKHDILAGYDLVIVGSMSPDVASEFERLRAGDPRISYSGYLPDDEIETLYRRARFAVFASNDEGFGLPICESLCRGVPVLCASFGSMAEIAAGGGCLTVDVNSPAALRDGLIRLAVDDQLRDRLIGEIEGRSFRTWSNYAGELIEVLAAKDAHTAAQRDREVLRDGLGKLLSAKGSGSKTLKISTGPIAISRVADGHTSSFKKPTLAEEKRTNVFIIDAGALNALENWPPELVRAVLQAEAVFSDSEDLNDRLVEATESSAFTELPPGTVLGRSWVLTDLSLMATEIHRLAQHKYRLEKVGRTEGILNRLGVETRFAYSAIRPPVLSIIISTFNRWPFVRENVRWLIELTEKFQHLVEVIVLDNVSTDESFRKLTEEFIGRRVKIYRNCSNVGMLGNLRECTALVNTPFVWMVGDDDYVNPSSLEEILEKLRTYPELPLLFTNFGVYYREKFGPTDNARAFIDEHKKLAPQPSPSGLTDVKSAAIEHDNLFTAIYPIIFRSDIATACFNYPFDQAPFSNLIEAIPTTKIILETYACAPCFWLADIGIAGNGVNSWRRWRMRWHGAIMPEVFALADLSGVDASALHRMSSIHWNLFAEAAERFPDREFAEAVGEVAIERSTRIFRRPLPIPE